MVDIINTTIGARRPNAEALLSTQLSTATSLTASVSIQEGDPNYANLGPIVRRIYVSEPQVGDTMAIELLAFANPIALEIIEVTANSNVLVSETGAPHYNLITRSV